MPKTLACILVVFCAPLGATSLLSYGVGQYGDWSAEAQLVGGVSYVPVVETFPANAQGVYGISVPGLAVENRSGPNHAFDGIDTIDQQGYHGRDAITYGLYSYLDTVFTIPAGTIGIGFDFTNFEYFVNNPVSFLLHFDDGSTYDYIFPPADYTGFYGLVSTGPLLTSIDFYGGFWNTPTLYLPDPVPEPGSFALLAVALGCCSASWALIHQRRMLRALHCEH